MLTAMIEDKKVILGTLLIRRPDAAVRAPREALCREVDGFVSCRNFWDEHTDQNLTVYNFRPHLRAHDAIEHRRTLGCKVSLHLVWISDADGTVLTVEKVRCTLDAQEQVSTAKTGLV